jgi:tetratricopeptide (TPR) repeat protein
MVVVQRYLLRIAVTMMCLGGSLAGSVLADGVQTSRRVRFNEGIVAFTERDYATAERLFAQLSREDESDFAALYWLGLCQLQSNQYAEAHASFDRVLAIAPDYPEVQLDAAIALIGRDQFTAAQSTLEVFVAAEVGDEVTRRQAHYFLGVAQFRLQQNEAALESLATAETGEDDPAMQAIIGYYRAWIFFDQRRNDEAIEEFKRVSQLTPNLDLAARAQRRAEQIEAGQFTGVEGGSRFSLSVSLGMSYDSNVVLLGDSASIPIDITTEDDFRFGLSSDLRYLQPLGDSWLVGAGTHTFHSWHGSLQEFNVQTYDGRVFLNYFPSDVMTFGFQYEYEYSLVDNDAFLSRSRLTPSVRYVHGFHEDGTPTTASTAFYAYEDRNYHDDVFDARGDRDGDYHTVGVVQSFNFNQPRLDDGDGRWLAGSISYRWKNESTQGDDFDMTGHSVSAGVSVPLPDEWLLDFSGSWGWEHYWQPNTQDFKLRPRDDFVQRYIWGLQRDYLLDDGISMTLRGEVAWTLDDSNIRNRIGEAVYSYDRFVGGITVTFSFR